MSDAVQHTSDLVPAAPPSLRLVREPDGLAWVLVDCPRVHPRFATDLEEILAELETDPDITAVVLSSTDPRTFLGAVDAEMLASLGELVRGVELAVELRAAFDRVARLPVPVVAAIQGECAGGGLDLALACRARVAADEPRTRLGYPEVASGIVPFAGAARRLAPLVGFAAAVELVAHGREVGARAAAALGLVDEVVAPAILRAAAARLARELADGTWQRPRRRRRLVADGALGRRLVLRRARRELPAHEPAARRALGLLRLGAERGPSVVARAETTTVVDLAGAESAQRRLARLLAAAPPVSAPPPRRVVVVDDGAAAAAIALAGIPARIVAADDARAEAALTEAHALLAAHARRSRLRPEESVALFARLGAGTTRAPLGQADLVWAPASGVDPLLLEPLMRASAVLAVGGGVAAVEAMADGALRPGQVVGLRLVDGIAEVARTPRTAEGALALAHALAALLAPMTQLAGDTHAVETTAGVRYRR